MASALDGLLPAIASAQDAGLTLAKMKSRFVGKTTSKDLEDKLRAALAELLRAGEIWGPLKHSRGQYYFAAGRGPSIETASAVVVRLVLQSGTKMLSKPGLAKKVTGMNARFFPDAIKHAVAGRAIVELSCGSSKYYLHRDVAADYFGFETAAEDDRPARPATAPLPSTPTFEELLPVYRRLKAEQGGFSAVKIFDLMTALAWPKDALHRLLLDEARAGRITIHPTTSVELPRAVIDAGIRLDGNSEPFVTVVVKDDR